MATLMQDLEYEISRLEKERPDSRLLKDLKRQYDGLKFNQGKDLKEVYFAGMTGEAPQEQASEWPETPPLPTETFKGAIPASRLEEDDK